MNEHKPMHPINGSESLQNIIIDDVLLKISDAANDAETTSKEKYIAKKKIIQSADDMTTEEKLDAMDKNYDRRNQERLNNIICFSALSIGVVCIAFGSPIVAKNLQNFFTTE